MLRSWGPGRDEDGAREGVDLIDVEAILQGAEYLRIQTEGFSASPKSLRRALPARAGASADTCGLRTPGDLFRAMKPNSSSSSAAQVVQHGQTLGSEDI